MKAHSIASTLAFTTAAFAGHDNVVQYPGILTQWQANTIVGKYSAVLQGQGYDGMTISQTAASVVAPNYVEISDSILSLEGAPVRNVDCRGATLTDKLEQLGGASATSEQEWYEHVTAHPTQGIITHDILVAGGNNILWYWTFPCVGSRQYQVKGFNLLRIDINQQIYEADIEFNSIAWGADTHQLQQYCAA
ncbi:hypothetical protein Tdes44962_MAKER03836 [Teratosphaeria destructans]|uniref:NTF2-like domain-containing protein n=1 Tax=Teratosphaeria destructans TaxID=418781 RepID=A0A9W7SP53_9PEZI|nr:hypothetical protein Tdes44962_MAKER03836 [Teratosphaeria destructans]